MAGINAQLHVLNAHSDVVFLRDPPDSLVCLVCLSVADKPKQMNCCGKIFCASCLTQHMDLREDCPHCRQEGDPFDDKKSAREIQALRVKCGHHDDGCGWVGPLSTQSQHTTRCNYEFVSCKYAAVGCEAKVIRKDIKQHEENDQLHLQLLTEKTVKLSTKVAALENKVLNMTNEQKAYCLTFKMTNFEHHVKIEDFESSFNTTPPGYKVRVNMGYVDCLRKFECFVSLKKKKGSSLPWPFPGSITVEILNQLENKNHHVAVLHKNALVDLDQTDTTFFYDICHSNLMFNPHLNTQYLKNDSLVIRITIQLPTYKPWLETTVQ